MCRKHARLSYRFVYFNGAERVARAKACIPEWIPVEYIADASRALLSHPPVSRSRIVQSRVQPLWHSARSRGGHVTSCRVTGLRRRYHHIRTPFASVYFCTLRSRGEIHRINLGSVNLSKFHTVNCN